MHPVDVSTPRHFVLESLLAVITLQVEAKLVMFGADMVLQPGDAGKCLATVFTGEVSVRNLTAGTPVPESVTVKKGLKCSDHNKLIPFSLPHVSRLLMVLAVNSHSWHLYFRSPCMPLM